MAKKKNTGTCKGNKIIHCKILAKTRMCEHFLQGFCNFGDSCSYAHTLEELQAKPDWYKTRLCVDHTLDCFFAHSVDELRFVDTYKKTKKCMFYLQGRCIFGSKCNYAHGDNEIRGVPESELNIELKKNLGNISRNTSCKETLNNKFKETVKTNAYVDVKNNTKKTKKRKKRKTEKIQTELQSKKETSNRDKNMVTETKYSPNVSISPMLDIFRELREGRSYSGHSLASYSRISVPDDFSMGRDLYNRDININTQLVNQYKSSSGFIDYSLNSYSMNERNLINDTEDIARFQNRLFSEDDISLSLSTKQNLLEKTFSEKINMLSKQDALMNNGWGFRNLNSRDTNSNKSMNIFGTPISYQNSHEKDSIMGKSFLWKKDSSMYSLGSKSWLRNEESGYLRHAMRDPSDNTLAPLESFTHNYSYSSESLSLLSRDQSKSELLDEADYLDNSARRSYSKLINPSVKTKPNIAPIQPWLLYNNVKTTQSSFTNSLGTDLAIFKHADNSREEDNSEASEYLFKEGELRCSVANGFRKHQNFMSKKRFFEISDLRMVTALYLHVNLQNIINELKRTLTWTNHHLFTGLALLFKLKNLNLSILYSFNTGYIFNIKKFKFMNAENIINDKLILEISIHAPKFILFLLILWYSRKILTTLKYFKFFRNKKYIQVAMQSFYSIKSIIIVYQINTRLYSKMITHNETLKDLVYAVSLFYIKIQIKASQYNLKKWVKSIFFSNRYKLKNINRSRKSLLNDMEPKIDETYDMSYNSNELKYFNLEAHNFFTYTTNANRSHKLSTGLFFAGSPPAGLSTTLTTNGTIDNKEHSKYIKPHFKLKNKTSGKKKVTVKKKNRKASSKLKKNYQISVRSETINEKNEIEEKVANWPNIRARTSKKKRKFVRREVFFFRQMSRAIENAKKGLDLDGNPLPLGVLELLLVAQAFMNAKTSWCGSVLVITIALSSLNLKSIEINSLAVVPRSFSVLVVESLRAVGLTAANGDYEVFSFYMNSIINQIFKFSMPENIEKISLMVRPIDKEIFNKTQKDNEADMQIDKSEKSVNNYNLCKNMIYPNNMNSDILMNIDNSHIKLARDNFHIEKYRFNDYDHGVKELETVCLEKESSNNLRNMYSNSAQVISNQPLSLQNDLIAQSRNCSEESIKQTRGYHIKQSKNILDNNEIVKNTTNIKKNYRETRINHDNIHLTLGTKLPFSNGSFKNTKSSISNSSVPKKHNSNDNSSIIEGYFVNQSVLGYRESSQNDIPSVEFCQALMDLIVEKELISEDSPKSQKPSEANIKYVTKLISQGAVFWWRNATHVWTYSQPRSIDDVYEIFLISGENKYIKPLKLQENTYNFNTDSTIPWSNMVKKRHEENLSRTNFKIQKGETITEKQYCNGKGYIKLSRAKDKDSLNNHKLDSKKKQSLTESPKKYSKTNPIDKNNVTVLTSKCLLNIDTHNNDKNSYEYNSCKLYNTVFCLNRYQVLEKAVLDLEKPSAHYLQPRSLSYKSYFQERVSDSKKNKVQLKSSRNNLNQDIIYKQFKSHSLISLNSCSCTNLYLETSSSRDNKISLVCRQLSCYSKYDKLKIRNCNSKYNKITRDDIVLPLIKSTNDRNRSFKRKNLLLELGLTKFTQTPLNDVSFTNISYEIDNKNGDDHNNISSFDRKLNNYSSKIDFTTNSNNKSYVSKDIDSCHYIYKKKFNNPFDHCLNNISRHKKSLEPLQSFYNSDVYDTNSKHYGCICSTKKNTNYFTENSKTSETMSICDDIWINHTTQNDSRTKSFSLKRDCNGLGFPCEKLVDSNLFRYNPFGSRIFIQDNNDINAKFNFYSKLNISECEQTSHDFEPTFNSFYDDADWIELRGHKENTLTGYISPSIRNQVYTSSNNILDISTPLINHNFNSHSGKNLYHLDESPYIYEPLDTLNQVRIGMSHSRETRIIRNYTPLHVKELNFGESQSYLKKTKVMKQLDNNIVEDIDLNNNEYMRIKNRSLKNIHRTKKSLRSNNQIYSSQNPVDYQNPHSHPNLYLFNDRLEFWKTNEEVGSEINFDRPIVKDIMKHKKKKQPKFQSFESQNYSKSKCNKYKEIINNSFVEDRGNNIKVRSKSPLQLSEYFWQNLNSALRDLFSDIKNNKNENINSNIPNQNLERKC